MAQAGAQREGLCRCPSQAASVQIAALPTAAAREPSGLAAGEVGKSARLRALQTGGRHHTLPAATAAAQSKGPSRESQPAPASATVVDLPVLTGRGRP
ncbi:hypothetical protein DBR06_SOUSAS810068 [Sousa chinensis]|uniref:Uncharacterized protein n=1 Tax=Sousa chinensis TaxID=103600 RepID=A0A484GKC7_SOUCH|nr:hypothetical protein DBR06_SOUSAS810068 [Sousa chinensis]